MDREEVRLMAALFAIAGNEAYDSGDEALSPKDVARRAMKVGNAFAAEWAARDEAPPPPAEEP